MSFLLLYTNPYGERYWLCNLGLQWPHDPSKRLIERTTASRSEAKAFPSEEEARAVLITAGSPRGWEVVENLNL